MRIEPLKMMAALLAVNCCMANAAIKVQYKGFKPTESVKVAVDDLLRASDAETSKCVFEVDRNMRDGQFGYSVKGTTVTFVGGDEMSVAHGCYTYLEDRGYTFDFGVVTAPSELKPLRQLQSRMVEPKVRWRGIRQHVNFPMDISSYSIEDAKDYLRSLHRMRFNKLTVHSYPGQWYETHVGDSLAYAGHFFYGDTHYVAGNKWLNEQIPDNDSIFCIPEAEKIFEDKALRSRFAVKWMQQLVDYATDLGFYVQMSFEPRSSSVEQAVRTACDVLATYPHINSLELITEETGGWGPRCEESEVKATLQQYFSAEVASNAEVLAPIKPKQTDLNALYEQVGINVNAIKQLQKANSGVEFKLGIYSAIREYTRGAYRLARLALPDVAVCLMPSHGSAGTAAEVKALINKPDDMRHTEIYSWIEFDGLMYLYQNSIGGNDELMQHLSGFLGDEQVPSLLYNHWRTAENRTSARYAAAVALQGEVRPDKFYADYAQRMKIADEATYVKAMQLLNEANDVARAHLGNIGFCWVGAWRSGGSFAWVNAEQVAHTRAIYLQAGELLEQLILQSAQGSAAHQYLSLVGNRVLCSILYLDAFIETAQIRSIAKEDDGTYSEHSKKQIEQCCARALGKLDQYMKIMAQMMPDRGCEGTLVSIWNAPVRGLNKYMNQQLGTHDANITIESKAIDAPPLPIFYELPNNE
ncbi:MAG: hypothetical protein ACI4BH_04400 [Muribaculaceae bacterium]